MVVDRTSRSVEAILMPSRMAAAGNEAIISSWVSQFGVPDDLTTDRGGQFTDKLGLH